MNHAPGRLAGDTPIIRRVPVSSQQATRGDSNREKRELFRNSCPVPIEKTHLFCEEDESIGSAGLEKTGKSRND